MLKLKSLLLFVQKTIATLIEQKQKDKKTSNFFNEKQEQFLIDLLTKKRKE